MIIIQAPESFDDNDHIHDISAINPFIKLRNPNQGWLAWLAGFVLSVDKLQNIIFSAFSSPNTI